MKRESLGDFIEDRVNENRHLFSLEELEFMNKNRRCIDKIYLLGAINSRDCFKNSQSL